MFMVLLPTHARIPGERHSNRHRVACSFHDRIMSATVRENVLCYHEYDEVFYNLVLDGMCYMAYSERALIARSRSLCT
jgi:hypothetical protein